MAFDFIDINLPLLTLSIVIGYQITIYFFYQYYKVKKEKLDLNMLLLAYGLLYGFGLTGIAIRYIYYFLISNETLYVIFIDLSHTFIFLAAFSFQLIISKKCFNEILNVKISKTVASITLIISILLFFIKDIVIIGILILIAALIGAINMVIFHMKLIKMSTGVIKRRIYFLFIGEVILIGGILIFSRESQMLFPLQIQNIMQLLFSIFIFLGLLIIFFGVFKIPIFLEFHWREKLLSFFIIDSINLKIIYSFDFNTQKENIDFSSKNNIDYKKLNILFPRGIIGIQDIISFIPDKQVNNKIQKIKKGEFLVHLRYSDKEFSSLIYCLVINKEMRSIDYFFKILQKRFESFYKYILVDLAQIEINEMDKLFLSFDKIIKEILK